MSCTEEKDILLMREMAAQGIFQFKSGSRERGNVWQAIAKNLNGHKDLFNSVTSRGVRDRFTLILRRYKARNAKEIKSTGEGSEDEQSEYDLLLEELTHLSEESDVKKAVLLCVGVFNELMLNTTPCLHVKTLFTTTWPRDLMNSCITNDITSLLFFG